jgi:hypothetical protein
MRDVQSEGMMNSTSNSSSSPDIKTTCTTLSMTGSAIRQLAIQDTASLETTAPLETIFDLYYDLKWSVAKENRVDVLPQY